MTRGVEAAERGVLVRIRHELDRGESHLAAHGDRAGVGGADGDEGAVLGYADREPAHDFAMEIELAQRLVNSLKKAGINFLTYLPETRLSQILPLMREDGTFQLIPVASEAEGITIAAGAVLGGKQAACYMESSGLYVSSYSMVTIGKQLAVPILLVVGFLGGFGDQRNSFLYATIGNRTIPLLQGLGIEYSVIEDGSGPERKVTDAVRTMNALRAPVALLFAGEFSR